MITTTGEVAYGPRAKKLTAETIKKQVEAALAEEWAVAAVPVLVSKENK
jgi:hypothetical protein